MKGGGKDLAETGLGRPEASSGGEAIISSITNPPPRMGGEGAGRKLMGVGMGVIRTGNEDLEARIPPSPGLRKDI